MTKKFYVTTPIYYPNDIPHIGHAYTTLATDVVARWYKKRGYEVFFLTGTDEHGKKIQRAAEAKGLSPKKFVDSLVPKFKEAWKKLNIKYDRFIRTTDKNHEAFVKNVLQKVYDKGDIYKGEYEGYYCVACEAYYTEKDLIEEDKCPIHKKKVDKLKEESYFFKLSEYQKKLLDFYKEHPEFISPKNRRQEIINRVKEGLRDLSISRTSFKWGIELPFDKEHISYVWFDALFNYYSATREKGKEKFWPADVHLIGKDILWFHTVYWPAFLFSAGISPPEKVFAHGWWTFDKEKISKSRGKVINVDELIKIAGVDSARYFLFREAPFGDDGDFSKKALIDRHNNELANKLGNLVSRVASLIEKYGRERINQAEESNIEERLKKAIEKGETELGIDENGCLYPLSRKYHGARKGKVSEVRMSTHLGEHPTSWLEVIELFVKIHIKNYQFDKALNDIFKFIDHCNWFIQIRKLWETNCKNRKKNLERLRISILKIAELLSPFIPESAEKIEKQFSAKKITKGEILFPKIK